MSGVSSVSSADPYSAKKASQLNETSTEKRGKKRARDETNSAKLPQELLDAIKNIYQPAGIRVTNAHEELESKDYGACRLEMDDRQVVFRVAKTTPKKVGQFVTVWQRPRPGAPYVPFHENDDVEFIVVSVCNVVNSGQFVFDKQVLIEQGIMGSAGRRGKGAFRLYSPWTRPENRTAMKTKEWQARYFLSHNPPDLDRVRRLFKTVLSKIKI